jgi:signal transduction histidine kinase
MGKPKHRPAAFFVLYAILLLSALVWVQFKDVGGRAGDDLAQFYLLIAAAAVYVAVRAFLVLVRGVSGRCGYLWLSIDLIIITLIVRLTGGLDSEAAIIYLWPIATSSIQRLPYRTLTAGAVSGVLYAAATWPAAVNSEYLTALGIRLVILALAVSQAVLYAMSEAGRVEENARLREELALADYRDRLSREMHDGIQHYLADISVRLEMARKLAEEDPAQAAGMAVDQRFAVRQAADELRYLVRLLRSPAVDREGLATAVRHHLSLFGARLSVSTPLEVEGGPRSVPPQVAHSVFRIVQEALMNIEKHARAGRVKVALKFGEDSLRCIIADDGIGFSPVEVAGEAEDGGRFGLVGMRQRAEAVGGQLHINSSPGQGTEVVFTVPLEDKPRAAEEGSRHGRGQAADRRG